MKKIVLALALVTFAMPIYAEDQLPAPKLKAVATAKISPDDNKLVAKRLKDIEWPKSIKLEPVAKEKIEKEMEVQVLQFNLKDLPSEEFLRVINEKIKPENITKILDAAGFRPATLEEALAARPKFKDVDCLVAIYGTKILLNGKKFVPSMDFEYHLGADIMTYTDGSTFGMFQDDWSWNYASVALMAVKK